MTQISNVEVQVAGRRMPLNRVKTICEEPSLTKQSFTESTSIRKILERYAKTGILGDPSRTPIFGDFSKTDFVASLNLVSGIKSGFEKLNVRTRERFKNDPAELLEFLADEKNNDEAIKLGLREAPPVVDKPREPLADPATPPA